MIKCWSQEAEFKTLFTNGRHQAVCDTLPEKGGGDAGFWPHELLEAALACCINITLRKYAASRNIPLTGATVEVTLNREVPGEAVFTYSLALDGPLTAEQVQGLHRAAASCAVSQTLSRKILFKAANG